MSDIIANGYKGFPECKECQCYPEGRNDCQDHMKCRAVLGYQAEARGVCPKHGPYGDQRCFICEPHDRTWRMSIEPARHWWEFWK